MTAMMAIPDLEVDRETPLGVEGVVRRVVPKALYACLRSTEGLKFAQEIPTSQIFLYTG